MFWLVFLPLLGLMANASLSNNCDAYGNWVEPKKDREENDDDENTSQRPKSLNLNSEPYRPFVRQRQNNNV